MALAKEIHQRTVDERGFGERTVERRGFDELVLQAMDDVPDFGEYGTVAVQGPPENIAEAAASYTAEIAQKVVGPLAEPSGGTQRQGSYNNNSAILLSMAMKLARKLPHEIDRADILRAAYYEGLRIGNALSEAFTRYKGEQYSWAVTESERGRGDVKSLIATYRAENPPPWETLRDVLDAMRDATGREDVFNFEFTDPDGARINHADHRQFSFETVLTSRTTGDSYVVQQLSSGESILMALCMVWFNQALGPTTAGRAAAGRTGRDAAPVDGGRARVYPEGSVREAGDQAADGDACAATVAVLDDGEIFRVTREGGNVRIRPVSRSEAVEDLSEGIATLDLGLRIATTSAAPVTIVTEGDNALHLKRWAPIHFPRDVHVFDQFPDRTGASNLRACARILAKMNPDSHLLFVWDCDQADKVKSLLGELRGDGKVTSFVLERRENPLAPDGIENKYDEEVLGPYLAETRKLMTGELLGLRFNGREKTEFAEHMCRHGTKDDFRHFDDLRAAVAAVVARATGKATFD